MPSKKKQNNTVIAVSLILLLGIGLFALGAFDGLTSQTALGPSTSVKDCPDSTGILTVNAIDALQKGTAVGSPTITAGINGGPVTTSVTSGTTTFAVGDRLDVLVSKADYIDQKFEATMTCGGLVLEAPLYASSSDNPAIRIKNDDGDFMTDAIAGGAVNQTDLSAGESFQWDVEFSGTNLESSGEGIYILEFPAGSSANITSVTLSGAKSTSLPTVHTTQNAGSFIAVFEVPAVVGATKEVKTLEVALTSAKDLAGGVYTDWYAKQWFVDDDGSLAYGVQDSDGTAKYENTLDMDVFIN